MQSHDYVLFNFAFVFTHLQFLIYPLDRFDPVLNCRFTCSQWGDRIAPVAEK